MKQNCQKNKVVTGKPLFFVISQFCTPILLALTLASDRAVLYENVEFLILVLSTKKTFRKFVSELKYWKRSKFPVIVTKHADFSNGGLF